MNPPMNRTPLGLEPIVGRYLQVDIAGRRHRVYVEETGQGIPLVCLHTAGSDTRQFRAVLNDPRIQQNFRVISFDLPYHGKSSPPEGWQNHEYKLTTQAYTDAVLAVCDGLQLDKPVVMGCSIGGRLVLHLGLHHASRFSALIGLQSGAFVDPYYELEWLHRPDVHGGELCAGLMSGLIGPDAPAADRHETLWHYMQSGPGVFKGDLHFYKLDGDMRGQVAAIRTDECPLHLLTGEYDYSSTPDDTRELARLIPGVQATIMAGMGHFPMSEDPVRFLPYLHTVLDRILARKAAA
jgi:pimeloyl-ACP methyl ester carboxylesterase